MTKSFQHLGSYSDIVTAAGHNGSLYPSAPPGIETQQKAAQVLQWGPLAVPQNVHIEQRWEEDGLQAEQISWTVGYGPRTQAWLFKPKGVVEPLPAVLALHDHGAFKFIGKEKIADGPAPMPEFALSKRGDFYGDRAWVNALAKEGYVVLVHDVFLWGSRRFPRQVMEDSLPHISTPAEVTAVDWADYRVPADVSAYNYLAVHHEHVVAKYLALIGTNLAAVVCYEDRLALNYLRTRSEVISDQVACMGLSGGGARAGLLRATAENLKAAAVIGMMSSYPGLLDRHVECHTWMFFPNGWARYGDWPDLVACQAPAPLLVQYDLDDDLFTREGMQAAHSQLSDHYRHVGAPEAYCGQFYPGPHKFDLEMQTATFAWLQEQLQSQQ